MVMRVEHVDGEYKVVLPFEALEELHLKVGTEVEVRRLTNQEPTRLICEEEALRAYTETEPMHRNAYRELAK